MNLIKSVVLAMSMLLGLNAMAIENLKGEAEAGGILQSGANNSESYNSKFLGTYTLLEKNIFTVSGRYLRTTANGVESVRNWEAGVRYTRDLNDDFGVYVGQKIESDIFNGYLQRESTDAGLRYSVIKSEATNWFFEAGYRYQKLMPMTLDTTYSNLGRIFTEFNKQLDTTLSFRYWAEYLPNFTDHEAYLANTEASLNIMLNSVFSLKLAYLIQYQNMPSVDEYTTNTTTMNLVAKF